MENRAKLSMNVKGITPSLFEAGKVKIGRKGKERPTQSGGTFQMPEKLDHFLITRTIRGQDNNFLLDEDLMKSLPKDADDKIRRIPITLLYDDLSLNFQSRFACYSGRTLSCSGDGENANQAIVAQDKKITGYKTVPCPCHRSEFGYKAGSPCKLTGRLQFLIRGSERIGGVHVFRTTGRNSVVAITSSLALVQRITGGFLAGIPLDLVVSPKQVVDPDGKPQTVYLVAVEYAGNVQTLQDHTHKNLLANESYRLQIQRVEDEARKLLTAQPAPFAEVLDEDDEGEFFPTSVSQEGAETELNSEQKQQSLAESMKQIAEQAAAKPAVQHEPESVANVIPQAQAQAESSDETLF